MRAMVEADKNPIPKLDLFPRFTAAARFIFRMPNCLATHGDHEFEANHGGGPLLDRELERQRGTVAEALLNMNQVYFPDAEELGA